MYTRIILFINYSIKSYTSVSGLKENMSSQLLVLCSNDT